MSFTQELTCRWSTLTWTPTRLLPARSFCTEIVTQELLHRGSANFQVIKLYLNSCKIRLLQFFYFSLVARTARRWLTNRYPLRRVGHPNVWRNAGLVCPWATLCGDGACRMETCGVVKCETSLPAAAVCGDRAFWTPKHVVECEFLLGTGNPLQRSRRSDIQTCGKMQIWWSPAQPLRTKWGSTVKNWCKIVILKVQMQAWHESQTAITVGKLRFFNVRCQRSRTGVKLRLYPFWNVRHNRFARNKTCVKLRFYKGVFKVSARMRLSKLLCAKASLCALCKPCSVNKLLCVKASVCKSSVCKGACVCV